MKNKHDNTKHQHTPEPHTSDECDNKQTTPVGFEPTRGDPIGLAGRRLNRSAKVSVVCRGTGRTAFRTDLG